MFAPVNYRVAKLAIIFEVTDMYIILSCCCTPQLRGQVIGAQRFEHLNIRYLVLISVAPYSFLSPGTHFSIATAHVQKNCEHVHNLSRTAVEHCTSDLYAGAQA